MKNQVKVLVVEDDRASLAAIVEIIHRMGLKTVPVNKPADALNVAKLQTVHAAVIDVLLPKMSGVDLAAEFRKTKFAEGPVILISGVFKDKAFAQEAMTKTGAVNFLFKPYEAQELIDALQTALAPLLTAERWTVQSLLTRQFKSARDRAKAIERLDRIRGLEFPFVLSLLTDAKISGHVNIVSDSGEIFGVTLSRGTVTEVDSSESQSTGVHALISNGYLASEDWENFKRGGRRKFSLDRLVQEGLVSPHAVSFAKREQIIDDLKAIFSAKSVQVNFVRQDEVEETSGGVVTMSDLLTQISGTLGDFFPLEYLQDFYAPVADSRMQVTAEPERLAAAWTLDAFTDTILRRTIETGGTLNQAVEATAGAPVRLYAGLHYLVLNRYLIFEDANRSHDMAALMDRYRKMHAELAAKSPDQVFAYFGGGGRLTPPLIERIFNDYERSNAPQSLPKDAPAELVDLCRRCFDLITAARAVMIDDVKRNQLFEGLKAKENEMARHANELQVKGLDHLRQGRWAAAIETLTEAERNHASSLNLLLKTWAEVNLGALKGKELAQARLAQIEALPNEDRRSTYYFMAVGTLKRALGDRTYLLAFERAFELDPSMTEARREISAAQALVQREKKQAILTGDLSSIVTGFFRRKAD